MFFKHFVKSLIQKNSTGIFTENINKSHENFVKRNFELTFVIALQPLEK